MKEIIATEKAPKALGPYSQAVKAGPFIFASGQLPIDVSTGEFVKGGIAEQTRQSLLNVKAILETAGASLSDVVKSTVFLSDMNNFAEMNKVYGELFGCEKHPARSAVQVARLPKDALIEIEVIALAK